MICKIFRVLFIFSNKVMRIHRYIVTTYTFYFVIHIEF